MRWIKILAKELKDTLRDRRTIMMMIVMPLVMIPLLITVVVKIQVAQVEKAQEKQLRIAFIGGEYAPELLSMLQSDEGFFIVETVPEDTAVAMTAREELDAAVVVSEQFPTTIAQDRQGKIRIIYKSSEAYGVTRSKLENVIEAFDKQIVTDRVSRFNLDKNLFDAISIEKIDISSAQEKLAEAAGGWLPYLFIIFSFMGAMYPGLDLGAGEKERGTLETLLSSPASRLEIVVGKFVVVMVAGIVTALIAMVGVYATVQQFPEIPEDVLAVIMEMLGPKMVLMIFSLLLPVTAFFAAVILGLSIYARSFKEAQSIITPMNIAIIFPAVIGTLPGIELNAKTALVPILNVSLATKEMLAGTVNPLYLTEVYASLFLLAGLSIFWCVKWFNREETLFRS